VLGGLWADAPNTTLKKFEKGKTVEKKIERERSDSERERNNQSALQRPLAQNYQRSRTRAHTLPRTTMTDDSTYQDPSALPSPPALREPRESSACRIEQSEQRFTDRNAQK
jgi:hypothetical protein